MKPEEVLTFQHNSFYSFLDPRYFLNYIDLNEMSQFYFTATPAQLPFNLHLRSPGFREESRDACSAEGTGGERRLCRFRDSLWCLG